MRILGLDPGLQKTGWGLVTAQSGRLSFVACGTVKTSSKETLADRLVTLSEGLEVVVRETTPDYAAVEETVVNKNPLSSLKLGHARGVVLLSVARAGLSVETYNAKTIKRSVTGTGAATKEQVIAMIGHLLPLAKPGSDDEADALATAICCAHHLASERRFLGMT